uniref:CCHC-type domain-containing protein n=1 Tax=Ananas comosus var. bracteatus TaxID=296719 RepID=A0A6V7Q9G8_ANACO|nr:unnamed protein product [Ananas comosus var. bracteatus]
MRDLRWSSFPTAVFMQSGSCYLCDQEGHFQLDCPRGPAPAPSSASAPASPGPSQGTPPAHYQAGRPPVQRQTEGSWQAPSGRMYAAQTEKAAAAENVVPGEPQHRLGSYHLDEVQGASFGALLPDQRQEEDGARLAKLVPGDRTVAEYEREFSRLLHCVPFVVRDDEDKARIFERGLRPSTFRFVQSSNLQTYREVVDRALIVESGAADVQEQREARDKGRPRGLRLRVRARRTLGGRRNIRGASSVDAAQQRIEEDLIGAGLPRV